MAADGLYVYLGALPYYWKQDHGEYQTEETTQLFADAGLGYIVGNWFYFGGTFHFYSGLRRLNTNSAKNEHKYLNQMYGPSIGWMGGSWFWLAHYYAYAEQRDEDLNQPNQVDTVRTGAGYGTSLGYRFHVGALELGPMLTYKNIRYTNCKDPVTGVTGGCNPESQKAEVIPYVTLLFNFR